MTVVSGIDTKHWLLTVLPPECFSYIAINYKGMWYSKNIIILHVLSSSGRGNFPNKVVALNADSLFVCLFVCCWRDSPPVGQSLLIQEVSRLHTTTLHSR